MAGAAGTHLLRRRRSSPRGLPLLLRCRRSSSPRGLLLLQRHLGPPLPLRLCLKQLPRRAADSFWSCCMMWSPPQPPLASLPAARVSRRGIWGIFQWRFEGDLARDLPRRKQKSPARPLYDPLPFAVGDADPMGAQDSSIGFGARAPAVVERDDGVARFLHLMSAGRVFWQQKKNLHVYGCPAYRCICHNY